MGRALPRVGRLPPFRRLRLIQKRWAPWSKRWHSRRSRLALGRGRAGGERSRESAACSAVHTCAHDMNMKSPLRAFCCVMWCGDPHAMRRAALHTLSKRVLLCALHVPRRAALNAAPCRDALVTCSVVWRSVVPQRFAAPRRAVPVGSRACEILRLMARYVNQFGFWYTSFTNS